VYLFDKVADLNPMIGLRGEPFAASIFEQS